MKAKLPGHKPGLPGNEISFLLCPLTPPIPLERDGALAGQGKHAYCFSSTEANQEGSFLNSPQDWKLNL
jgi:hypothetical protein